MSSSCRDWLLKAMVAGPVVFLAACATPPPPPPPPPAPPPPPPPPAQPVEVIPYRPVPPAGASYQMDIPRVGPDGRRVTVNTDLNDDLTIWHFRSALNVAALNCNEPEHAPITQAYGEVLKKYDRRLKAANTAIERQYRAQASTQRDATRLREAKMTQVYNYFANPGTRQAFCAEALAVSNEMLTAPTDDVLTFASNSLSRFEAVFEGFYRAYEKYEVESAAWDARYGERYGPSQPGWVALHGVATPTIGSELVELNATYPTGEVKDPETGATIPVIPAPGSEVSMPVVQPIAQESDEAVS